MRRAFASPTQNTKRADAANSIDTTRRFHPPTRDGPPGVYTPQNDAPRLNNNHQETLLPHLPNPPPHDPRPAPLPRLDPRQRLLRGAHTAARG